MTNIDFNCPLPGRQGREADLNSLVCNSEPTIAKDLSDTKGFVDHKIPKLLVSGEMLSPFFCNAENLCGDLKIQDVLKEKGNDSAAIIRYACNLAGQQNSQFAKDIVILSRMVEELMPDSEMPQFAISGGQTRDWLFSGPVSRVLNNGDGVPHISLYKQSAGKPDRVEIIYPDGSVEQNPANLNLRYVIHVADLLTKASSCYSKDSKTGAETGWIPMLRNRGATINDLVAVVSRLQGGEQNLARVEVNAHAAVYLDRPFLLEHSTQASIDLEFNRDPEGWTRNYLRLNGPGVLMQYFEKDPQNKNRPRARKFMGFYGEFLEKEGLLGQLDKMLVEKHGKRAYDILAEKD